MSALTHSTAYLRGLRAGFRLAGRSLWRRFLAQLVVAAVLWGGGLGFLWASAEVFVRLSTGEPSLTKVVLTKVQSWNRLYR